MASRDGRRSTKGRLQAGEPYYSDAHVTLFNGEALDVLRSMPDESVQCCVTSPPYWGLRDYGHDGQLGLEPTPEEYVERLVEVFREVRRVLREDGTLWLNLGDSYVSVPSGGMQGNGQMAGRRVAQVRDAKAKSAMGAPQRPPSVDRLKPKDLVGIPWRVAFALQADGWYLRSDIIWAKPNPMPESVRDRPTKAHEYVFLLSKSASYFYDADAIAEESIHSGRVVEYDGTQKMSGVDPVLQRTTIGSAGGSKRIEVGPTRNRRTVWTITTKPYPEAHFATFPPELPELCIKAGCPEGGAVLDPFAGAGTTLLTAKNLNRLAVGIELNPEYCDLIGKRVAQQVLAL